MNNKKALAAGIAIGAVAAVAATAAFIIKKAKPVEVHLFQLDNQEDREDLEELLKTLIPKPNGHCADSKRCSKCSCTECCADKEDYIHCGRDRRAEGTDEEPDEAGSPE